jgi:putative two-component system response regulator
MKFNVVIVDDTASNISLISDLISSVEDCTAIGFTSARHALAWCLENKPDLVIFNYAMPEFDGVEILKRLRMRLGYENTPVMILTDNNAIKVRHLVLQYGANDFIVKPIDPIEFVARIRNLLALQRSQRQLKDHAVWLAEEIAKATEDILAREHEMIFRLSKAVDSRDPVTGAHVMRMAHFSRLIAKNLGLSDTDQETILAAAPMHDIGKIATPDYVLLKQGRLSSDEFDVMKRHTTQGYDILQGSQSVILQAAAEIALTHHEKFDGTGYPQGLVGNLIPLFARICSVADVFDALTSMRPYKMAWEDEAAIAWLRKEAGFHFDPDCVEAFLANWDEICEIRARFVDDNTALNVSGLGEY